MSDHTQKMFGCNISEFMDSVHNSLTYKLNATPKGIAFAYAFIAMSQLSDAQEEIERGMLEEARQTINRAKYLLSEIMEPTCPAPTPSTTPSKP
jgi:hypothetical protein